MQIFYALTNGMQLIAETKQDNGKMEIQTTNIVDENIKRIGELFPNCLTERLNEEGKSEVALNFEQLRQELQKDIVEGTEEHYQLTWSD